MRVLLLSMLLLATLSTTTLANDYHDNNYGEQFDYYDHSEEVYESRFL